MKLKIKILIGVILTSLAVSGLVMLVLENTEYIRRINELVSNVNELALNTVFMSDTVAKKLASDADDIPGYVEYDVENSYYNGLALVKKDGKWGYIDKNRHVKIPLIYDSANNFTDKIAKVKKDNLWGYINTKGEEIIPVDYYFCGEISNGIIAVGKGGKYGFIDRNGNKVCELLYDRVEPFNEDGTAKVVIDRKFGYINASGKVIVPIEIESHEENADFTGVWNRTGVHSSLGATLEITHQMATSFDFKITSQYYSIKDTVEGMAEITSPNTAKFVYGSGNTQDTITFTIVDNWLEITSVLGGNLDMNSNNTIDGKFTNENPVYTNEGVVEEIFKKPGTLMRIRQTIGESLYEDEFLYGFRNGLYSEEKLPNSSILTGTVYRVYIPTTEKDFKILVNEMFVYFYSKNENIYKSDDPDRQMMPPAAISYDEI